MKPYSKYYIVAGSCILIVTLGLVARWFWPSTSSFPGNGNSTAPQPTAALLPGLNGTLVPADIAERRPIAVVIDNHPDARPASGLSEADVVYETLAEGGITRFLAIYQTKAPENVGPIRSARVYFNELAAEWGAIYAHVGGNSDALAVLKTGSYPGLANADQYFYEPYFHRVKTRSAPHNVHTSIDQLRQLAKDNQWSTQTEAAPWTYQQPSPQDHSNEQAITIPFSTPKYTVSYTYDPVKNVYIRKLGGGTATDNGVAIAPTNVLIQFAQSFPTKTDTIGSISFNLDRGGKATIITNGVAVKGSWKKVAGRTRFYTETGAEVTLSPGQTWVEIVPVELAAQVTIK